MIAHIPSKRNKIFILLRSLFLCRCYHPSRVTPSLLFCGWYVRCHLFWFLAVHSHSASRRKIDSACWGSLPVFYVKPSYITCVNDRYSLSNQLWFIPLMKYKNRLEDFSEAVEQSDSVMYPDSGSAPLWRGIFRIRPGACDQQAGYIPGWTKYHYGP